MMTVSEWADSHRLLPETSAARGGRWRTATTPYLAGVMDSVHEPGVRTIAVMKAAQVGVSEALNNVVGYFIASDPSSSRDVGKRISSARSFVILVTRARRSAGPLDASASVVSLPRSGNGPHQHTTEPFACEHCFHM